MEYSKEKSSPLRIVPHKEAVEKANLKIHRAKHEKFPGLICRWGAVNAAMGGFFRFGEITSICGASGSGKSYILNMLRDDFAGELNKSYPRPFKILSFSFEMSSEDEVIRTYSSKTRMSYSNLISSFTKLSDESYDEVIATSKNVENDVQFFVESIGNWVQIYNTVSQFSQLYPEHQLIITLDHTLLVQYLDESSEVELVSNMARLAMILKKEYRAMVIFLGQLNDKIEQVDRLVNLDLHYPKKTDIHGSKSVYMASDTLIITHRPQLLNLEIYGPKHYPTEDLIAWHFLKSRLHGNEGIILMKQEFDKGNLIYPYIREEKQQTLFSQNE